MDLGVLRSQTAMNLKSSLFVFACLFMQVASAQPAPSFDDLYPRRPFTGKSAVGMEWSHDDRYLAYLWNPYKAHSMDIWVYDTQSGKSTQLTSIELMKPFDRDIPKAIERYKTEDDELDRADRMSDLEYREWTLK